MGRRGAGRRKVLRLASGAALALTGAMAGGVAAGGLAFAADTQAQEAEDEIVRRLIGGAPVASSRVRLDMPAAFGNGYSVPMTVTVDSPMTDADHVRRLCVLAPGNPIVGVAEFRFTPQSGRAELTTRIRLAEPQSVIAVAEMSDGALLMARTWVNVSVNGCE